MLLNRVMHLDPSMTILEQRYIAMLPTLVLELLHTKAQWHSQKLDLLPQRGSSGIRFIQLYYNVAIFGRMASRDRGTDSKDTTQNKTIYKSCAINDS